MEQYKYDFSIIMPIYNVEEYLKEAVESLIHQTIGFDRIQLIMVDDGSLDKSSLICDGYKSIYPENIVVIHKENGGASSARNAGIPYVKGKYINFLDPDDTFAPDVLEKVLKFMQQNDLEVDVCCIPLYFFGDETGQHQLNYKFDKGTRVVNLSKDENAECILMSSSSAFYKESVADKLCYDLQLYTAEDAKVNLAVLMDNPKLGLVADAKYNYRKRVGSILNKSHYNRKWYTECLHLFSNWALDTALDKFGFIPKYVQYPVMYDLQWKLREKRILFGILSPEEEKEYTELLFSTACRIDDDVILNMRWLSLPSKNLVLSRKFATKPTINVHKHDADLLYHATKAVSISEMDTRLEFIDIQESSQSCVIEGFHNVFGVDPAEVQPILLVNNEEIHCDIIERPKQTTINLGIKASSPIGFRAEFPIREDKNIIYTGICYRKAVIKCRNIHYGKFFPISDVYDNAYAIKDNALIRLRKGGIVIQTNVSSTIIPGLEVRFLKEIWEKNLLGGRKAVIGRLYYHAMKSIKRRQLWIISDRFMKADDNGEALFNYIMSQKPQNTRVVFAINKNSPDYARIREVGECVNAMSFRHKLLHLLCDVNISSQADDMYINPFSGHDISLRDLLCHQQFIFLQHGITKDDISDWLQRYNKNMYGFVTSAKAEWTAIAKLDFGYPEDRIWLTGMPRYDRLYNDEKRIVTIMPTWRRYLMDHINAETSVWVEKKDFWKSSYYEFYRCLLNSERLLNTLEKYNYTLQFYPHPTVQSFAGSFVSDKRVKLLLKEKTYREVYAESSLVITDYSSAVFDFAYLRKPVMYCQFDKEEFFSGDHVYKKGYFDYERDGFGEITYNLEDTIDTIIEYVENDCKLKDKYRNRIDDFFAFNDKNNCKRVYEKILSLSNIH